MWYTSPSVKVTFPKRFCKNQHFAETMPISYNDVVQHVNGWTLGTVEDLLLPWFGKLSWIKNVVYNLTIDLPHLDTFSEFQMHGSVIGTSAANYSFVKFMDKTFTSSSEYLQHLRVSCKGQSPLLLYFNDTYPQGQCNEKVQNPKHFSWNEAKNICNKNNAQLPELVSREMEEVLVHLIQSVHIFLLEALYIDLRRHKTVKVS